MRHAAILEKVIRYMPVAEETFGGTPICKRRGLKMTPPPSPRAPATQPPPNPKQRTFTRTLPWNKRSLGTILIFPYLILSAYSLAEILTAKMTTIIIAIINAANVAQSPLTHLSNICPLRKLITIKKPKLEKLINYLIQTP